ncbi:uncharacterized protein LOC111877502 [Lactuca sativa]|uniref:Uncharacterized protein n=1 Tax=Lactuca sativa TaxID=4236 RepID=A0A9R1V7D5_LACSA|nr:uncharacterized protein LOC111877502 [Lactuca sativa]KAJ0200264.1 hypothetical protein LSAT_V11C600316580 [Lactuca sativa]
MQSTMNIRTTYGLPLCLSGLTNHHHLSLSKQIADHDRRREAMKVATSETRSRGGVIDGEVRENEVIHRSSDLRKFSGDDDDQSSLLHTSCTAKAA